MKNKTTTYALLAVVLFIWGYIVYRIYTGVTGDDVVVATASKAPTPKTQAPLAVNDYELTLNYRDPFLGAGKSVAVTSSGPRTSYQNTYNPTVVRPRVIAPTIAPIVSKVQETIDWSVISFNGIMKNPNTNKMVAILIVSGHQYLLGEGGVGGGVKVFKVYKDSLKISYKNIHKTITR